MKITNKILGSVALATILAFSVTGCGSDNNTESVSKTRLSYLNAMGISFEKDMTALTDAWTSAVDEEATAINAFKAKSEGNGASDLIQGCIDIANEVHSGKIADPLDDPGHTAFDTTKVESQFSWNSSADFYNNINSVNKIWNAGLKDLVVLSGYGDTADVDAAITDSLTKLAAISNLNVAQTVAGTATIAQADAFRNKIQTAAGDTAILAAQTAIEALEAELVDAQTHLNQNLGLLNGSAGARNHVDAVADNEIKANYVNLGTNATALKDAITALKTAPSAATVTAARTAWKLVRANWESSEAYIVATAPSLGAATDGNTDSWPVTSQAAIEANLDAWDGDIFTIVNTDGETKGFHTIEYLLFGTGAALESAADAATRLSAN